MRAKSHFQVSKIFITHLHGDHLYGLPGLLCTLGNGLDSSKVGTAAVEVIGPVGLRKFIAVTLGLSRSPLAYKLDVTEIEPLDWQYPEDWSQWEVEQELTGSIVVPTNKDKTLMLTRCPSTPGTDLQTVECR